MSAPANRWKLGLFVIAGCAVGLGALSWLGATGLQRQKRQVWAYFDEALTGLEEGSPVRFRGVRIGAVEAIRVGRDQKHLAVQMGLFAEYLPELGLVLDQATGSEPLQTDLRAQVVMSWVTGTAFVQVDFFPDPAGGPQKLPFACAPNTLRTVSSTAKSFEDAGREVLRDLPALVGEVRELVQLLHRDVTAAALPALAERLQSTLTAAEQQLGELRRHETVASVTEAFAEVGAAARSLRADQGPLGAAVAELRGLAADLRGELQRADLAATGASARSAVGEVQDVARGVAAELATLRAAVAAVGRLAALLEQDPAALLRGRSTPARSPLTEMPR